MAQIVTSNGHVILLDDADLPLVSQFTWHAHTNKGTVFYARSQKEVKTVRTNYSMHRLLLSAAPGQQIDHINGNGLDNRRCNLRFCTQSENTQNSVVRRKANKSCIYKGVSYYKRTKQWIVRLGYNGKQIRLGYFNTDKEAAEAYDHAASFYYGQYAKLNFSK